MKTRKISEGEKLVKIKKDIEGIRDAYHLAEKKLATRRKKWRDNNPEKAKASNKRFLENNPEYLRNYSKNYYKKNKSKLAKQHAEYMKSEKGKIAQAKKYLKYVEEKVRLDVKRTKWTKPLNMERIEECKKLLGIEVLPFLKK